MKTKTIITISTILILALGISTVAFADSSISSKGVLVFDNNTADTSDDIIFDASDLTTIENTILSGKGKVANKINTLTGGSTTLNKFASFDDLVSGIEAVDSHSKEEGKSNAYKEIKDAATGLESSTSELSNSFASVTDLASLKAAVVADNTTAYNKGIEYADSVVNTSSKSYADGLAQGMLQAGATCVYKTTYASTRVRSVSKSIPGLAAGKYKLVTFGYCTFWNGSGTNMIRGYTTTVSGTGVSTTSSGDGVMEVTIPADGTTLNISLYCNEWLDGYSNDDMRAVYGIWLFK